MTLPLPLDYAAMEAKPVASLPSGDGWQYEPKWDGFRCLAFKDGAKVVLRSKAGQPLERYFPEVVAALAALDARRCVLDGELVIPNGASLSFDALLQRVHPAPSRIARLARETPALYIVFDLLVDERGRPLVERSLADRRDALERFAADHLGEDAHFRLSPATTARDDAERWLAALGASLDGIVAKRVDKPYAPGERTAMQKFKRLRTADCVVGGFRYGSKSSVAGSLLLGLFDDEGLLHHVGFTSNLPKEREELTRALEALQGAPGFTGRAPGGPSRWSSARSGEWVPLATKLVVEVQYDHFSGGRFRHGTKFLRWRPDKPPRQCTLAQVDMPAGDGQPAATS